MKYRFCVLKNVSEDVIAFVQAPVDVTVTWLAELSTSTVLPASNSALVAVDGLTLPTSAVKLKFGPKLAPNPAPNVNVIFIAIFYFIYIHPPSHAANVFNTR